MPESLVYYDFNKEMQQVGAFLQANSDQLADNLSLQIQKMIASGMDKNAIVQVLVKDLRNNGRMFSGFTSLFGRTVSPALDDFGQGAIVSKNPSVMEWEWVTQSADPCDDCAPRHGEVKTYDEWKALGLPRSGFSVCKDHCKCLLVPHMQGGASLKDGPVNVDPIAAARADFQNRLKTDASLQQRVADYRASTRARKQ